jgi:hypothetical protein
VKIMRRIDESTLRLPGATALGWTLLAGLSLAPAVLLAPSSEHAVAQPAHGIKIVVPLPPGGAGDIVARLLAEQVGRAQGGRSSPRTAPAPERSSERNRSRARRPTAARSW